MADQKPKIKSTHTVFVERVKAHLGPGHYRGLFYSANSVINDVR